MKGYPSRPRAPHTVMSACAQALSHLPRLPYTEWITVLSGLANEFGEEQALRIAGEAGFKDERRNETAVKIRQRLRNVSFGSVIFVLRRYGIDTSALTGAGSRQIQAQRPIVPPRPSAPHTLPEPCIYRFTGEFGDSAEERAGIYQFDAGCSRYEAEHRVRQEFPHLGQERLYRCSVSTAAMNKNITCSWKQFMGSFDTTALSLEELQTVIWSGYAIAPFLMKGCKSQAHWLGAELCCVDVDGTMTLQEALEMELTQHCLFLYTSPSHSEAEHRFRLVFALPHLERQMEVYRGILERLIAAYRADASCSDPSKFYYGNSRAWLWQPSMANGERKAGGYGNA